MSAPSPGPRVAFVTAYDASDPAGWSGVALHMSRALAAAGVGLEYVGSLRAPGAVLAAARRRLYRLAGRRYMRDRDPAVARAYAAQVAGRLRRLRVDAVLSPGTIPVAHLDCRVPIVVWTDATFGALVGFYPEYSRLCRATVRGGHDIERRALARCARAVYTSEWAGRTAVELYGADPARVRTVPFGANLAGEPRADEVAAAVRSRRDGGCRLVFLGRDWERKGGPFALAVARELERRGVPARLAIVGCTPQVPAHARSLCDAVGPLDTGRADGRARLAAVLSAAHFLVLPTRADCTPHAVGEANAYGVPCLTTDVGGLRTIVRDGGNGALFPLAAPPERWAGFVAAACADRAGYERLALSSYASYRERLNWKVAAACMRTVLEEVLR